MTTNAGEFWAETERYHDLAEHFGRNIEMTHPDYITVQTSFGQMDCGWYATRVKYYEYRGEDVTSF